MTDRPASSPFSGPAVQRAIEQALADLPAGRGRVLIRYRTTDGAVHVTTGARVNEVWRVGADLRYAIRDRRIDGEIEVIASW